MRGHLPNPSPDQRREYLERDALGFPDGSYVYTPEELTGTYLGASTIRKAVVLESGDIVRVWAWRDMRNGRFIPHIVKEARHE